MGELANAKSKSLEVKSLSLNVLEAMALLTDSLFTSKASSTPRIFIVACFMNFLMFGSSRYLQITESCTVRIGMLFVVAKIMICSIILLSRYINFTP